MRIGILSTGDELLRGALVDTNAAHMAARFHERGFYVARISTIGDDLEALTKAFSAAFDELDLVVVSGGLGPTDDDLTAAALSAATGVPLVRRAEAEATVRAAFERRGWPMHPVNLKQAEVPEGCDVLDNPVGSAPGFAVSAGRARAFFLPGPPRELIPMFERYVLGALPEPPPRHVAAFRLHGIGESDVQGLLAEYASEHPALVFGYRAMYPEIGLRITAPDASSLAAAADETRRILGARIFAEEEIFLPAALGRALAAARLTIGTAESCTGGLVAHELTRIPGASAYFRGAIVAYYNEIKMSLLGVAPSLLAAHGAVSPEVASAMAEGARRALGVDVACATTGIAGPDGGTAEKPVGLVYLAVATARGVVVSRGDFHGLERSRIKMGSAWAVMRLAFDALRELP